MCHFEFNEESYNQFSPRGRGSCESEQCVAGPAPGRVNNYPLMQIRGSSFATSRESPAWSAALTTAVTSL